MSSNIMKALAGQNVSMNQNYLQDLMSSSAYRNPLIGMDLRSIPLDELENTIELLNKEFDRRTLDTPLQGPTRRELLQDEALAHAWDAFMIVRKLKGIK